MELPPGLMKVPPELEPLVRRLGNLQHALKTTRSSAHATAGTMDMLWSNFIEFKKSVLHLIKLAQAAKEKEAIKSKDDR